jgi:hypothetical protein
MLGSGCSVIHAKANTVESTWSLCSVFRQHSAPSKVARFRQVDVHVPYVHHDALDFADGTIVPVARLIQGQWATVLQLPSAREETHVDYTQNESRPEDALL